MLALVPLGQPLPKETCWISLADVGANAVVFVLPGTRDAVESVVPVTAADVLVVAAGSELAPTCQRLTAATESSKQPSAALISHRQYCACFPQRMEQLPLQR